MSTINSVGNSLSGVTGTGSFVGSNSPSLTSPSLGVATATSINFGGSALSNYVTGGTWTPVVVSSGGGTCTYTSQLGTYSRIGNIVTITMYIAVNVSSLNAGTITITGLPFSTAGYTTFPIYATGLNVSAVTNVMAISLSNSNIVPYVYAAGTAAVITAAQFGTGSQFIISGSYLI